MAVGLTVPSKPKTPLGALVAKTSYAGATVPPPASAAPATPGGTSPQSTTDWFTRQTTAPPQPAATTNAQASWDYAADPAHAKEATTTPYGGMVAGAPIVGPRPVDEASIARERELAAQKEATDLAYARSQAEKASDVEAARTLALQQQQMGILPGGATGTHAGTAGAATGGGLTLEQIQEMMRSLGISTTPAATAPAAPPAATIAPPAPPARVEMPAAPDTRAADAATWARSKDIIGRSTSGALKSLREAQAARGFGAESGVYGAQEGEVMSEGLRSLGDVARTQAENTLAADRAREELGYQGDITQRAQDLGLSGAGFSGGITQRGQDLESLATSRSQDIQSTGQRLGLLPSLLSLLKYAQY